MAKRNVRDELFREAGSLDYDHIEHEFRTLAQKINWPRETTLKDWRHLFATTLGNTAMPEAYRRYLMGHAPGRAAIFAYTHLNQLRQHYGDAVSREWTPLIAVINRRLSDPQ